MRTAIAAAAEVGPRPRRGRLDDAFVEAAAEAGQREIVVLALARAGAACPTHTVRKHSAHALAPSR